VKPQGGCHVEITVGVVDAVEAPEDRDLVGNEMLKPDRQIEGEDGQQKLDPGRPVQLVEKANALLSSIDCRHNGKDRHGKGQGPYRCRVDCRKSKVCAPALTPGLNRAPPWREAFQQGEDGENAEEGCQSDCEFVRHVPPL
jgi:hypothetical protein